jgi:hypothetical protein
LEEIQSGLPFDLLGLDSDNGSEFINWHLQRWCQQNQIQLTRGRPYKKDDNAHIEQKNWTQVGKLLGWEGYDSRAAVEAMNDLYRHELRLWLNLSLPSVKLVKKVRVGSKVRRVYDAAQTPLERVLASASAHPDQAAARKKMRSSLNPFQLGKVIEQKIEGLYEMANQRLSPQAAQKNRKPPVAKEKMRPPQAVEKPLAARAWKSLRDSHFPTATTASSRLHSECLDGDLQSYILKWLDTSPAASVSPQQGVPYAAETIFSR